MDMYRKLKVNKRKAKPGDLIKAMHGAKEKDTGGKLADAKRDKAKGIKEGSKRDQALDKQVMHKTKKMKHKKMKHMKPKGAKGRAQVKKLGRTYKTGGFSKIAAKAGKKYGSKESGKRVAGAIFQAMARKHVGK